MHHQAHNKKNCASDGSLTNMMKSETKKTPRHGLARVLSKQGIASRTQAARLIREGRVRVNGHIERDPEFAVRMDLDIIEMAEEKIAAVERLVVMLNKPRGLVTTTKDERGRDTVYRCFDGSNLPWLAPVGRLDKASEGLLLFTNDPQWAASITDPQTGPDKTYHVQINSLPAEALLQNMMQGIQIEGEWLSSKSVRMLRSGDKNCWLEMVLDEGKNRQIRRLLKAFDIEVLRLLRVAMGALLLGELAKGKWRELSAAEVDMLSRKC